MNKQKLHDRIIAQAQSQNRKKGQEIYYEQHHIIPRSMGGSNEKENLVLLTAREHFLIHYLLAKIHNNSEMWYAFNMMCGGVIKERYIISRLYEANRKHIAEQISNDRKGQTTWNKGISRSEETKRKQSEAMKRYYAENEHHSKGKTTKPLKTSKKEKSKRKITPPRLPKMIKCNGKRKHSEETKREMSEIAKKRYKEKGHHRTGKKGKPHTDESKLKISMSLKGREQKRGKDSPNYRKTHTLKTKLKIPASKKGVKIKPFTEEHKRKISESIKRKHAERKQQSA